MSCTVAEKLGVTPHLSPLLRKARRLGLATPDALLRLAVQRGCRHYAPPDFDLLVEAPGPAQFSDLELAIALCSAAQCYEPVYVRCAAQLLGGPNTTSVALAQLARMERCEAVVAHIATAAILFDRGHESFWENVLALLPGVTPVKPGVLPHSSRFVLHSGVVDPRRPRPAIVWLRAG